MISLDQKIQFSICKIRNIIYYRDIDFRPRAQYIHVLRQLRFRLFKLMEEIKNSNSNNYEDEYNFFSQVINIIKPKIKSDDCETTIKLLSLLYEQRKTEKAIRD